MLFYPCFLKIVKEDGWKVLLLGMIFYLISSLLIGFIFIAYSNFLYHPIPGAMQSASSGYLFEAIAVVGPLAFILFTWVSAGLIGSCYDKVSGQDFSIMNYFRNCNRLFMRSFRYIILFLLPSLLTLVLLSYLLFDSFDVPSFIIGPAVLFPIYLVYSFIIPLIIVKIVNVIENNYIRKNWISLLLYSAFNLASFYIPLVGVYLGLMFSLAYPLYVLSGTNIAKKNE